MSTTIKSLPDILTFRKMLDNVSISNKYDAVMLRHQIQDIESRLSEWKEDADKYLYLNCNQCEKAVIEDANGNLFAVQQVAMNEKIYHKTPEYLKAYQAVERAKKHLSEVQARTPSDLYQKGKGYYYKVCKP